MPSPLLPEPPLAAEVVPASGWSAWLARHPWLPFVLPLAVYLLVGSLGPAKPSLPAADDGPAAVSEPQAPSGASEDLAGPSAAPFSRSYPLAYAAQIAATLGAMLLVAPVYWSVPWRLSGSAVVYGVIGAVLWIGICRGGLEDRLWSALVRADWLDSVARPAFNPLTAFHDSPWGLVAFLAVRFAGLVVMVPIIEEFFVRGFLMRFFERTEWWTMPLGQVTRTSAVVATVYGVLAHPAEMIAAAVWFSLITLLYARTRNLWDCVAAHAVTNGLLGIYVLIWQDWRLW